MRAKRIVDSQRSRERSSKPNGSSRVHRDRGVGHEDDANASLGGVGELVDATNSVAVSVSAEVAAENAVDVEGQELRQRIRIDLEMRGVGAELALLLSEQLEERAHGVDDDQYGSLLDGVALAVGVNAVAGEELVRNTSEIREVERMMSAFAGELSKLDETLEVLAAYVRRMRTNSTPRSNRVIH